MSTLDFSREPLLTLNKDGISDELFKLLWSKDEMNFSPLINIPDTIIYKYGQPTAWYFTSNNGHIKKKNKFNLVSSKIEDAFNRHPLGYDVIAYFITMPNEYELTHNNGNNTTTNANTPTMIEYLDRDGLNKFLYNHKKEVNGILQKFIEPKTTHNEVIRAIWSPKLILLEKAENIHELHDKRYGLYEKCVLYEGPDYYYQTSPLRGPVMSGQIQKLVETSIAHINEVTFGQKQISRIVLTFKLDSREKLWLLYSTSIRCIDMMELKPLGADDPNTTTNSATSSVNVRNLLNIDNVITLPEKVSLNPFKSYSFTKESKLPTKQRIACISCTTETLQELRHPITYKSIIKHYDHVLHLLQSSISLKHHNRKEGTIAWPPDREIVEAAGGVGFCGLLNFQKLGSTGLPDTANNDNNSYNSSIRRNSNKEETTYKPRRRNDNIRYKSIKDVQIPPIIISLHPKLTTDTYERCKNDPLFYNKTIHVCESCYLVYAEFTTMLLQLGDNIHKLLSSDSSNNNNLTGNTTRAKMNNPFLPQGGGGITGSGVGGRPTSADWRAISQSVNNSNNVNASSSLFQGSLLSSSLSDMALQHHYDAKQRSIGLRSDDQREHPLLPNAVRSATDTAGLPLPSLHHHTTLPHEASMSIVSPATSTYYHAGGMLEDSNSLFSPSLHKNSGGAGAGTGGVGGGVFAYDSEEVKSMIADRERRFFKEISLNPQLKDSHPLQHLISTQQKLKLINEQSGILMSNKKATTTTPLFNDSQYGKQSHTIKPLKYAPYATELPYTVNGEIVLPSELRKKKMGDAKLKKLQKQRTLQSFLSGQLPNDNDDLHEDHDYNYNMMKSETTPDLTKILKVVEQHTSKAHTASTGILPNATTTTNMNNNTQKKDPIDQNIKNSKQYRSFLSESLKRIEDDVQDVNFDTSPKSRHRSSSNNNSNNNSPNRSATTRMKMSATAPSPMNSTIGSTPLSRNTSSSKYPRKGGNSDSGSGNNSTASSNRTSPRDSLLNVKPKGIKDRAAGRLIEEIVEEEEREAKRAEGGKAAANDLISEIIDEEEIEGRRAEGGKAAANNLMKEITAEEEEEGKRSKGGKVAADHLTDEIQAEEEKEGKKALGGKAAATHLVEEVVNEEEREAKRAEGGKMASDYLVDEVNEEEEKEGQRAEGGKAAASRLLDEVVDEEEEEGKRAEGGKKAANQLLDEISREEGGADDDDLLFSPYSQSSFEPPIASFPNPSPPNSQVPSATTAAQLEESDEYGLSESAIDPTVSTTQPHDIASSFTSSVIDEAVKVVSRENSRPSTAVAPPPPLPEWSDMEVEDDTSLMMSPPGLSAQVSDSELLEAISDSIIKEAMEQQDDQSVVEEVVEES